MRTEPISIAIVAALLWGAGIASAQPSVTPPSIVEPAPAPPPPPHRWQIALGGALRFTGLDPHADESTRQLDEYGWPSTRSPVMPGLGGEVAFLHAPIIDAGVAASWARGDHAAGLDAMGDRVSTTQQRFAVIARVHLAMGRPFIPEPRVDVGVVRRSVRLHGVTERDTLPYVRAAIDWRLGNRTGGAVLSAGYTITGRASSPRLDPAVGGLDVSIGPYLRF